MSMLSNVITVSRMRAFNACRRLHNIKYEQGFRATSKAEALSFGTLIHTGLEAWWKSGGDLDLTLAKMRACPGECDAFEMERATALMEGYSVRWSSEIADLDVLAVEVEFSVQIRNPATGYPCRELVVSGKIDVLAIHRSTGKKWLFEHKTSSEDLSAGSDYWKRLRMDPQISVYHDGALALGHEVEGCVYDVLAKPGERPKLATPPEKRKYTKKEGKLYEGQRETDETAAEYGCRIREKIAESPDSYFGRAEVIRTEQEMEESRRDVHATALMIREETRLGRAPRNPGNCFLYGRMCEFFDVCSGCGSLDDETRFTKLDSVHPELESR
jgi:PD-(D/E)XK nuclease superfamily